jgi:hypothetical protein
LSHLIDRILDTNSINKFLGIGNSYSNVIASFALALVTFFYIFTISSYFSVSVFILKNRVIYVDTFDKYVINQHLDHILIAVGIVVWFLLAIKGNGRFYMSSIYAGLAIIGLLFGFDLFTDIGALSSLPVIIFLLIYDRSVARKKILHADTKLSLNYLAIMGAITGVVGVILSFEPLLSIQLSSHIRNYAYDIFTLFSIFSPVLMFLIIFCFPVKLITNEFTNKLLKSKNKKNINNHYANMSAFFFRADTVRLRTKVVYLTLFVLLSIILVIIPHTPAINKNNQEIGVDTHYYVDWIAPLIRSNNTQEFIHQAFVIQAHDGDRPIALIFLFAIIKLVSPNDFSYTIEHVPLILGPALVLVVYFLTRELTSNEKSSLFASFLTAVSYQMLIGIYAGFYANWLAIIIGFISAIFLFKFLKSSRKRDIIVFGVSLVTIMLTHTYTWTIFVIVFVTFLAVMLATKDYSTRIIVLLLTVTLFSVVIDIARISITGSISGVLGDTQLASDLTGLEQFAQRWNTLIETVYIYVGGQFSNFIPLALGLYWLFSSDLRKASNIFMIIFLSTGLLPLFAGNWLLQVRVLYNIPFQIPAAIALTYMSNRGHTSRIFLPAIILWLTAASVTAVSNFYLIPTSQNMSFGTS